MAITKKRKAELVRAYGELLKKSEGLIITSYRGTPVKGLESLRGKVREASGEYHIVKNTLAAIALQQAGLPVPQDMLSSSSAIGFAFSDVPAVARAITDFAKDSDFVTVKGGIMDGKVLATAQIQALSSLPPLPVLRAQLLGLIQAPATRLTGTVASGVRQVVNVVKAFADKEPAPVQA